ncbi:hypothetical protein [Streptomyces sp. CB03911]|uniref:hypothetical protein n=1 Tax=Streptomyces sp. CB03911 TaxID=1804758 RepID=UPI0009404C85|nr:hypothetical protein [Streptomyces sp. CB03911]OKI14243.1 hypothetical protein A6A07_13920 [Streptomyces sp. CB03911]
MINQHADLDQQFADFAAINHTTIDQFNHWLSKVGRVHGPALLFDAWYGQTINRETLTATIGDIWSAAEYPDRCLDHDTWRDLFNEAGYTVDGHAADRPTEPVELWRGTVPERRTDWSWTTDRATAERFAAGVRGRKPGQLYRTVAPPEALLCANNGRSEAEYVVDTDGLEIHLTDPAATAA